MSFTLTPFLYQTRTILRLPAPRASRAAVRSLHATATRSKRKESGIPFEHDLDESNDGQADEPAPRGTITPGERLVFERIFSDIKARGLTPSTKRRESRENLPPAKDGSPLSIMRKAADDAANTYQSTLISNSAAQARVDQERADALLRFPPELRAAASRALDTIAYQVTGTHPVQDAVTYTNTKDSKAVAQSQADKGEDAFNDANWTIPENALSRSVEIEAKRQNERNRVEGLITSAATDFELWDVLEQEVFTMPARLGIKTNTLSDDAEPSKPHETVQESDKGAETEKLSLYIHGPLYPAYILLALRRLHSSFHAPSPLVFSILPRIKELGLESYVLGVSTPFYNELLEIYWACRGDLSGVVELLDEMRHCGLHFDRQTASTLWKLNNAVTEMANNAGTNGFARALMQMPEFELSQRQKIRRWHRTVVEMAA
ncbi:hypothetical protein F5Y18DRAFT_326993 [Xylariaceae sp. FL1019]|nr:hypothetical protein F5Y18DRAFT_326993 [Xylariaceae sp. FL1019]